MTTKTIMNPFTLFAPIMPILNGIIFCDASLKGRTLYVCLWEFEK